MTLILIGVFIVLKFLHKIVSLLHSETAPSQLAGGAAFGMIVGLTPLMSLHNLVIFLIVCLFRVNFSMFFLNLGIFSVLAFALDPVFDRLGYWILADWTWARSFFVDITSGAIWPFFRFNNTIVMGSLALSLIMFIPFMILLMYLIRLYRRTWREKLRNAPWVIALRATPIYNLYTKYQAFRARFGGLG